MNFELLCTMGNQADELLRAGRYGEAERGYSMVLAKLREGRAVDSFLLAKITLGLLLSKVRRGEVPEAHAIWVQTLEDGTLPGMGVHFLETGQTSTHDLIVYSFVSAYLHSMTPDREQALAGVQQTMGRIFSYALEKDPSLFSMAGSNYHAHLTEVFEGQPVPEAASAPLREWMHKCGVPLTPGRIDFPAPSKWVIDWGSGVVSEEVTVFTPDGGVGRAPIGLGEVQIGDAISPNGKKRVYRMLCNLAMSDGQIDPLEREVLRSIVSALGLPRARAEKLEREGAAGEKLRVGKRPAERDYLLESMLEVVAANGILVLAELKRLNAFAELVGLSNTELQVRITAKGLRLPS